MSFELYVLFTLSDNIERIERQSETKDKKVKYQKDSISWWRKKKLVLILSRNMSVSCLSFLTKQIDAERKCMARERSAWRENGEGNGPATATFQNGWGLGVEGNGHKQDGESTYHLGHSRTLSSALHVLMFSTQKKWGIIVKLEMLHGGKYLVEVFVDPVYAILICMLRSPGTVSVVNTKLHHFPAERTEDLYLDKESNFSQSHIGAIGFALLMKNSEENWKTLSIHFSFFVVFRCIQHQKMFKGTFA